MESGFLILGPCRLCIPDKSLALFLPPAFVPFADVGGHGTSHHFCASQFFRLADPLEFFQVFFWNVHQCPHNPSVCVIYNHISFFRRSCFCLSLCFLLSLLAAASRPKSPVVALQNRGENGEHKAETTPIEYLLRETGRS